MLAKQSIKVEARGNIICAEMLGSSTRTDRLCPIQPQGDLATFGVTSLHLAGNIHQGKFLYGGCDNAIATAFISSKCKTFNQQHVSSPLCVMVGSRRAC